MERFFYNQSVKLSACDQAVYQQDVVIHRSEGVPYEELVGGVYVLHFYVGDRCKEDYGDIRFTNSTGAELAYYLWPDYSSESARFAVRLEGADGPGTLTVWYGNSAAETTSDGDLTYTFFDDFSASIEWGTKWASTSQGSYSTADGKLITAFPASAANQINTFTSFSNAICECSLRNPNPTKQMYMNLEDAKGVYRDKDQFVLNFNTGKIELKLNGGVSSASVTKYSDEYYRYRYICPSSGTAYQYTYYPDGTLAHTHSGTPAYRTFYPSFLRWDSGYGYIDWIIVRTYSATPPAATAFGPERRANSIGNPTGIALGSANTMVI